MTDKHATDVIDFRVTALENRIDDHSALHRAITEKFGTVETAFGSLTSGVVRVETLAGEIKGDIRWVVKMVLGAVIMAILALVIKSAASQTPVHPTTPPSATAIDSTSSH